MYIIFGYNSNCPLGGMGDCHGVESTLLNAKEFSPISKFDRVEIYDVEQNEIHSFKNGNWVVD